MGIKTAIRVAHNISTFPYLNATLLTALGANADAIETVTGTSLTYKDQAGTSHTVTVPAAGWYRELKVSEITSFTGGTVQLYRFGSIYEPSLIMPNHLTIGEAASTFTPTIPSPVVTVA